MKSHFADCASVHPTRPSRRWLSVAPRRRGSRRGFATPRVLSTGAAAARVRDTPDPRRPLTAGTGARTNAHGSEGTRRAALEAVPPTARPRPASRPRRARSRRAAPKKRRRPGPIIIAAPRPRGRGPFDPSPPPGVARRASSIPRLTPPPASPLAASRALGRSGKRRTTSRSALREHRSGERRGQLRDFFSPSPFLRLPRPPPRDAFSAVRSTRCAASSPSWA